MYADNDIENEVDGNQPVSHRVDLRASCEEDALSWIGALRLAIGAIRGMRFL